MYAKIKLFKRLFMASISDYKLQLNRRNFPRQFEIISLVHKSEFGLCSGSCSRSFNSPKFYKIMSYKIQFIT